MLEKSNGRYYNKNINIIYNVMLIHSSIQLIASSLFTRYVAIRNTSDTESHETHRSATLGLGNL